MGDLKKSKRLVVSLLMVFSMGLFFMGCATTQQLAAVEELAKQALTKSDTALKEAQSAKSMVSDESKKSEAAALRAEQAADRSEKAADRAEAAADKAEAMADKAESIFMKKMKK